MVDAARAIDLGLLAYILEGAAPFYGRTKLQKATFLSELNLRENKLIGPHFKFYRWNNGPFSHELLSAYEFLAHRGFAYYPDQPALTRRGHELAALFAELRKLHENRKFFELLDATLEYCKRRTGEQLMKIVYEMEVRPESTGEKIKVEDMPQRLVIIKPPSVSSLKMTHDFEKLILQELEVTEEGIRKAEKEEVPNLVEAFLRRLSI